MIDSMTKAQEKKVPVYLNKWLKYGYRTKAVDKKKARKAVDFLYKDILKIPAPKHVVFLDSPMACQLAYNLLKNTKWDEQLESQLESQLDSQLDSQLRSQLDSQLYSQLDSQLESQKLEYYANWITTWGWGNYYGFYDFILNELLPEKKKDFKLFSQFIELWPELHYYLPFKELVLISDFPKEINLNSEHQLHSFDKPALLYRDTYSLYRSNGIEMKKEYIETPKDKITKEMFLSEENADMRRELIKKIGMPRTIKILDPKVVDKFKTKNGGEYRLLKINFDKRRDRTYLQMKCPSTKNDHILGVLDTCETAKEAWCFLNNEPEYIETVWEA
jgi:ribosomal protein L17